MSANPCPKCGGYAPRARDNGDKYHFSQTCEECGHVLTSWEMCPQEPCFYCDHKQGCSGYADWSAANPEKAKAAEGKTNWDELKSIERDGEATKVQETLPRLVLAGSGGVSKFTYSLDDLNYAENSDGTKTAIGGSGIHEFEVTVHPVSRK